MNNPVYIYIYIYTHTHTRTHTHTHNAVELVGVVKIVKTRPCILFVLKVKVELKFPLEQATKAQRWSRGIALLFL